MNNSMDNYRDHKLDKSTDTFCTSCGNLIEDVKVFAPTTEYEMDVELCESCYNEKFTNNNNFEKPF